MDNPQNVFEFTAARAARDAGIQLAADHADLVTPKWSELAYAFLESFSRERDQFTSEDVRDAAVGHVPDPPDLRAWGGVFMRASRGGLLTKHGFTTARAPKVHCSYMAIWRRSDATPTKGEPL